MIDRPPPNPFDARSPNPAAPFRPLPSWLARRLLRRDEHITWVVGPRFTPSCERYLTHPLLFVAALAVGVAAVWVGRLVAGSWAQMSVVPVVTALVLVLGSVFVLGIASGYFTRLVVTSKRVVVLQGYEVRRSWGAAALPRSLVRYAAREGEKEAPTIDLDAVKTLFGDTSGKFAESKTILAFAKQIEQIKRGGDVRP